MIPKRIRLENFLSFAEPALEFVFGDGEPLWVLCGPNGVGKSAVFDAITYALYGEHRGGTQKAEQLIRHGANGFRVEFDFEFAEVDYRITRTRTTKITQKVERSRSGEWEAILGVTKVDEVKTWVEKTLGLSYRAFVTSILLRQGEADKLFTASRDERISVLKGIIGFERFEEVSRRVHAAATRHASKLESLIQQKTDLVRITCDEMVEAEGNLKTAAEWLEKNQGEFGMGAQRVEQAKQWERLERQRDDLERKLHDAEQRAKDADTIRTDKKRLDDLTAAVPLLDALLQLQEQITAMEPQFTAAEAKRSQQAAALETTRLTAEQARQQAEAHKERAAELTRHAADLGKEKERGTKFLQLADEIEKLSRKLSEYPTDLETQVCQAEGGMKTAAMVQQETANRLTEANTLLQQAKKHRDRFADVAVGVPCPHCGQPVDAAHAAKERVRLVAECEKLQTALMQLRTAADDAAQEHNDAVQKHQNLASKKSAFDAETLQWRQKSELLTQLGGVANASELHLRLTTLEQEKGELEKGARTEREHQAKAADEAKRFEEEARKLDVKLKTVGETIQTLGTRLTTCRIKREEKLSLFTDDWKQRIPTLDVPGFAALAEELHRLQNSGVTDRFDLLRQDESQRAEWTNLLSGLRADREQIPPAARISEKEANRQFDLAERAADSATMAHGEAMRTCERLKQQADRYEKLEIELQKVQRTNDLHSKLDLLLGPNGLQRELVRDAEQQIVALANETLQNLSNGELSLEPDDEASGRDDKAFALRVRRAGDPQPIGVLFLSGSQKFRVAVSVALAVGRFASGRARPLEAVIIDEGFGSLDKDGLRAMAEELKALQQSQSLKRVILVSHQEEFTDQFLVGYRLTPGENGTIAVPFRR